MSAAPMPDHTLMSRQTFEALSNLRSVLGENPELAGKLANVMVPWCGKKLRAQGGLYYVGISTLGDDAEAVTWSAEDCLSQTEAVLNDRKTPFFQIMDGLCAGLIGCARDGAMERLGYSNLFKVHVTTSSNVDDWPVSAADAQRAAALAALQEELSSLRCCLVYVASESGHGVFPDAVGLNSVDFAQEGADIVWPRWYWDSATRNLYVWAYHSGYLSRQGVETRQRHVDFVVKLAKRHGLGSEDLQT